MTSMNLNISGTIISLLIVFIIVAIILILVIISNQNKKKLVEMHNKIVSEFHSSNKEVVNSLNEEISYLNDKKPDWGLHPADNKIRDVVYYKKTHSEIEEIVELSYLHDKKFDDIFNDTEKNIIEYEIAIEKFFKYYRKYHESINNSSFITRAMFNSGGYVLVEKIYAVLLKDKHNKEFIS